MKRHIIYHWYFLKWLIGCWEHAGGSRFASRMLPRETMKFGFRANWF